MLSYGSIYLTPIHKNFNKQQLIFLRIGSFEILTKSREFEELKILADFILTNNFPHIQGVYFFLSKYEYNILFKIPVQKRLSPTVDSYCFCLSFTLKRGFGRFQT